MPKISLLCAMAVSSTSLSGAPSSLYSFFVRSCLSESDIGGAGCPKLSSVVMSAEDPGISTPDNMWALRRRNTTLLGAVGRALNQ